MDLCGNTIAEINYDYMSQWVDCEVDRWKFIYLKLCLGETVKKGVRKYCLAERMANEYPIFADFVDLDYDFMKDFIADTIDENLKKLIETEASIMASVICGD